MAERRPAGVRYAPGRHERGSRSDGADASTANEFIQQVARGLTDAPNGSQIFDDQTVFSSDEDASALYLTPTDGHCPVFNFGLARVRYIGLIGATTVACFFRLFAAQSTTSIYDYPPGEQYRAPRPIPKVSRFHSPA